MVTPINNRRVQSNISTDVSCDLGGLGDVFCR